MRAAHTVADVRTAEDALMARLPEGALMQRAAAGLARRCAELLGTVYGARVVLLVGSGNNGGDALYAGAALARRGAAVEAVVVGDRPHAGGLAALRGAGGRVGDAGSLASADLVVDGLVGIGGSGALREPAAALASALDGTAATVVAVDVPSGVDADTGEVAGAAVRADVTVTFGTLKPGLVVSPGAAYSGLVELVDIGLAPHLPAPALTVLDAADVAALLPVPDAADNKYTRGVVGVVAGSERYTGAAVLATGASVAAGAGMVRYAGVRRAADLVRAAWPEVVVTEITAGDGDGVLGAGRVQAWVVGSGLGTDADAARVVEAVLGTELPVLVDADAITLLAEHSEWLDRSAPTVLTPHAGEFARLTGAERADVERAPLGHARRAAGELGVTVLLKGTTTVVADPRDGVRVNTVATPWLATAGSGDVLSGAVGSLLAQGLDALDAASVGAFLHGMAGIYASSGTGTGTGTGTGSGMGIGASDAGAPISAAGLIACWPDVERAVRRASA